MRILTLAAPGGAEARAAVSAAMASWNRGLDIRLRFLDIGLEETVLELSGGGGDPAAGLLEVEEAAARLLPSVSLLHGRGGPALAAAVSLAKAGVPVVRTAAGLRNGASSGEDRAADRLCSVLLAPAAEALAALAAEALDAEPFTPEAAVRAVIRLQREP